MKRDPNLEQIATETFLVPTDWVGYDNFPEKSPKFFAYGKSVFHALLMEAFFKKFFQGRFTCPLTANCRNSLLALF